MQSERLEYLLQQRMAASITPEEQQELFLFLREEENRETFAVAAAGLLSKQVPEMTDNKWNNIADNILEMDRPKVRRMITWQWAAAAAVLVLGAAMAFFWFPRMQQRSTLADHPVNHILPGTNKAILTLGDGSAVLLDSNGNQTIHQSSGDVYQNGGMLHYDQANNTAISYNTLTTPRGGQFQVRLPDGTMAWLNAASSVRYPTIFNGKERVVEVTGEAYFEVAANAAQPFIVRSNGLEVAVLGTHFNVNTYQDDATLHVTLLQGAVKVNGTLLAPGEQADVPQAGSVRVSNADTEQVMAWKNGLFVFRSADVRTVFNQLSRWYDVNVQYEGSFGGKRFTGKMPRTYKLEEVLAVLQESGIRVKIEGNNMLVQP